MVVPAGISAANVGGNAGYHQKADIPYIVVGVTSTGLTLADVPDVYAMGVSHEIAEVVVDPNVGDGDPEVCDPCDINCPPNLNRDYLDAQDNYLGSNQAEPPGGFNYAYYICAIVKPEGVSDCPASSANCNYAPVEPVMASPISLRQYLVCKNIDPATGLRSHFSSADLARGLRALVVSEPPRIVSFTIAPRQITSGGSITIAWQVASCCPLPLKVRLSQKNFHTGAVLAVHNGLAANDTLNDSPPIDSNYFLDASCEGGAAAPQQRKSVGVSNPTNFRFFCFKVMYPRSGICSAFAYPAASQSDAEQMARNKNPGTAVTSIDCSEMATACGG